MATKLICDPIDVEISKLAAHFYNETVNLTDKTVVREIMENDFAKLKGLLSERGDKDRWGNPKDPWGDAWVLEISVFLGKRSRQIARDMATLSGDLVADVNHLCKMEIEKALKDFMHEFSYRDSMYMTMPELTVRRFNMWAHMAMGSMLARHYGAYMLRSIVDNLENGAMDRTEIDAINRDLKDRLPAGTPARVFESAAYYVPVIGIVSDLPGNPPGEKHVRRWIWAEQKEAVLACVRNAIRDTYPNRGASGDEAAKRRTEDVMDFLDGRDDEEGMSKKVRGEIGSVELERTSLWDIIDETHLQGLLLRDDDSAPENRISSGPRP